MKVIPVSKLPSELRGEFAADDLVSVTVEYPPVVFGGPSRSAEEARALVEGHLNALRQGPRDTGEAEPSRIRALRDEWD
ncbi:MAG: hypothetical protein AAGF45_03040 [Pseudomonadota bacterium]